MLAKLTLRRRCATLAPLLLGVVPQAVQTAQEHRSLTESGLEGPGTLRTSYRSPMSSTTAARRPCSPPQRSFPSCPTAVPGPEESRAVAPHGCRTHRTDWGSTACARKRRSLSPGAAPAVSPPRRGVRRRASTAGGGRRLGAGAEGGKEAGREIRSGVGGRCALRDTDLRCASFTRLGAPTPFSFPPRRGRVRKAGSHGSSGFWEECLPKRIGACRELVCPKGPLAFCLRVWDSAPRSRVVGQSSCRLQQPGSSRKRVGEC